MLIVLESILWVIRFFFGACIFSFLNVVIDRLPRGESVVNGRSHCTNCGRVLHAWELIPCVSYIFLRGRCAGCKSRIPGRDFFVEVIGGAAFIGCGIHYGCGSFGLLSMRGTVMLIYFGILLVAALIDWDTQIIYDRFHIFILILAIANIWLVPEHGLVDRLIGALIISVPMLLLALVIPGAFGGGDIKLFFMTGLYLSSAWEILFYLILSCLFGLGFASFRKEKRVPFGPAIAAACFIMILYGEKLTGWYTGLF